MSHWAVCHLLLGLQMLDLMFIGPHCAVCSVTPPPNPTTVGINLSQQAGPDGLCPARTLPPLPPPSSVHSVPLPGHAQPLIWAPRRPGRQAVVMLLCHCLHKVPQWACFNVDCDASVSLRMFAIFVAQQVTRSRLLRYRLTECPCGETPFYCGASILPLRLFFLFFF